MNERTNVGRDFRDEIERALDAYQFRYVRDFQAGGLVFDFMVESDGGRRAILEAKLLTTDRNQVAKRAAFLAARARELAQADVAILVTMVPIAQPPSQDVLVCTIDDLASVLSRALVVNLPRPVEPLPPTAGTSPSTIFVAMPFSPTYDDTFFVAVAGAADSFSLAAKRVDKEEYVGDVVAMIRTMIAASRMVIADVSEARPNVLYEMGLAQGLGVPVIAICSGRPDDLPFDVEHENVIFYELGRTSQLKTRLAARMKAVLDSSLPAPAATKTNGGDDEEPGFLELLGEMEQALPRFAERLKEEIDVIDRLGEIARQGTQQIELSDAQGGKIAGRLAVVGRVATKLETEAVRLQSSASGANDELDRVDAGVTFILETAANDPPARAQLGIFPRQVMRLAEATARAVTSTDELASQMEPLEKAHRVLRPPIRRIVAALHLSHRWRDLTAKWAVRVRDLPAEQ